MVTKINQMGKRINELSDVEKRNTEYENKVVLATQEIERLNRVLRERNGEINNVHNELKDYEMKIPQLEEEMKRMRRKL